MSEWGNDMLIPVFTNCYNYLKSGKRIIIDMKEKYVQETLSSLISSGFKHIDTKSYNLTQSHYNKKVKLQYLITCKK